MIKLHEEEVDDDDVELLEHTEDSKELTKSDDSAEEIAKLLQQSKRVIEENAQACPCAGICSLIIFLLILILSSAFFLTILLLHEDIRQHLPKFLKSKLNLNPQNSLMETTQASVFDYNSCATLGYEIRDNCTKNDNVRMCVEAGAGLSCGSFGSCRMNNDVLLIFRLTKDSTDPNSEVRYYAMRGSVDAIIRATLVGSYEFIKDSPTASVAFYIDTNGTQMWSEIDAYVFSDALDEDSPYNLAKSGVSVSATVDNTTDCSNFTTGCNSTNTNSTSPYRSYMAAIVHGYVYIESGFATLISWRSSCNKQNTATDAYATGCMFEAENKCVKHFSTFNIPFGDFNETVRATFACGVDRTSARFVNATESMTRDVKVLIEWLGTDSLSAPTRSSTYTPIELVSNFNPYGYQSMMDLLIDVTMDSWENSVENSADCRCYKRYYDVCPIPEN